MALAYKIKGDDEKANKYLRQAEALSSNPKDDDYLKTLRFNFYSFGKDDKKKLALLSAASASIDSLAFEMLRASAVSAQNDYLEAKLDSIDDSARTSRTIFVGFLVISILAIISLVLFIRNRHSQYLLNESKLNDQLASYLSSLEEIEDKSRVSHQNGQMLLGTLAINRLSEIYYYPLANKADSFLKEYEKIIKQFNIDDLFFAAFEEKVNSSNNQIITLLKRSCPNLSEINERLFSYLAAGMSYTTICVLFGCDKPIIYNRVNRLRRTISSIEGHTSEILLAYIQTGLRNKSFILSEKDSSE